MSNDHPANLPHPPGEQPVVESAPDNPVPVDTFAGRIDVDWDPDAAVTPLGQLPFFIEYVTPKHPHCEFERRQWGGVASRFYPDKARMSEAGEFDRVLRRFQPRLRAVERTERSVANVSAPTWVRKPPDIFIFTFIIRMSCSA
jgi:hypothetical protein